MPRAPWSSLESVPYYGRTDIYLAAASQIRNFFLVETFALGPTASSILFKGNANDDKYDGTATNGNSNKSISWQRLTSQHLLGRSRGCPE